MSVWLFLLIFTALFGSCLCAERPRRRGKPIPLPYGNQRPSTDAVEAELLPVVWGQPLRADGTPLYQTPIIWRLPDDGAGH